MAKLVFNVVTPKKLRKALELEKLSNKTNFNLRLQDYLLLKDQIDHYPVQSRIFSLHFFGIVYPYPWDLNR